MKNLTIRARMLIREAIKSLPPESIPVIALSGGADSMALAKIARMENVSHCHIVDHGIQQVTAQVADETAEIVSGWGMTVEISRVNVGSAGGVESAARDARYEALLSNPNHVVLLAHTRRDQAETVLMGLGRGSGSRSLQGMKAVSHNGRVLRPFLDLTRADMEAICEGFGISFWNDPHNESSDYRRVRVRNELLPLMEDVMDGGVEASLVRTAESLQDDNDFLDSMVESAYTADCTTLFGMHRAMRRRIIREFLHRNGVDTSRIMYSHIVSVERLVIAWSGQKYVAVPGHRIYRRNGELIAEFDS